MDKKPQIPATYDEMFQSAAVFGLPYRRSPYYPLFREVRRALARVAPRSVLEVGCGTGPLAHLLFDSMNIDYRGFDFSPVAVERARRRTGRDTPFFVGDATQAVTYAGIDYEAVVCTEVLEHIEDDLGAVSHWVPGAYCVCSVPNYDSDTHVRWFRSAHDVRERYGSLIEIESIVRRRKPFLDDLSFAEWLKAVRWNRYRPGRLLQLMGISSFDRHGGWFVLSGRRRAPEGAP